MCVRFDTLLPSKLMDFWWLWRFHNFSLSIFIFFWEWKSIFNYIWIFMDIYLQLYILRFLALLARLFELENSTESVVYIYNNKTILVHVGFLFNIHKLCYTPFFSSHDVWSKFRIYKCQRSKIISVFEIWKKNVIEIYIFPVNHTT